MYSELSSGCGKRGGGKGVYLKNYANRFPDQKATTFRSGEFKVYVPFDEAELEWTLEPELIFDWGGFVGVCKGGGEMSGVVAWDGSSGKSRGAEGGLK